MNNDYGPVKPDTYPSDDLTPVTPIRKDPNAQSHHTFGTSPAAVRLKTEIDKPGCKYNAAVRLLNNGQYMAWLLLHPAFMGIPKRDKRYLLQMLRKDIITRMEECSSDPIVKSLCRNVFITKMRAIMKL